MRRVNHINPPSLETSALPVRASNEGCTRMCLRHPRGVQLWPSIGARAFVPLGCAHPPTAPPLTKRAFPLLCVPPCCRVCSMGLCAFCACSRGCARTRDCVPLPYRACLPIAARAPWASAFPVRIPVAVRAPPYHERPFLRACPPLPHASPWPCVPLVCASIIVHAPCAHPSLLCMPHIRAFLTRARLYCVRLPSISPSNLLFIPLLGHPGL